MGDLREELKQKNEDSFLEYEPGESLAEELERADRKKKLEAFREKLDRAYRDEVEEAKFKPLPRTIQAYRNVYRQLPTGWPHK